jgi:hypothetical protein
VDAEAAQRGLQALAGQRQARRLQAALDEARDAAADEFPDGRRRQGREPLLGEHRVGRGREVGRSVEQRAVQVEQDGTQAAR